MPLTPIVKFLGPYDNGNFLSLPVITKFASLYKNGVRQLSFKTSLKIYKNVDNSLKMAFLNSLVYIINFLECNISLATVAHCIHALILMTEVKQCRARSVLGRETAWKHWVLLALALRLSENRPFPWRFPSAGCLKQS